MAVVYLEPEDEITGAVARLRAMPGGNVVLVVPAGSRIATSRINFRLLEREARQRELRLALVSADAAVRALATAAGVAAHESVDAAEVALGELAAPEPEPAGASEPATTVLPVPITGTTEPVEEPDTPATEPATAEGAAAEETAEYVRPPRVAGRLSVEPPLYEVDDIVLRRRRRSSYFGPIAAVVLLLVLVGLGAYAAYLFLPTATITLQPKLINVGPLTMTVTADPRVAVVDAAAGLIPATIVNVPLQAADTFPATGTEVTTSAATGEVRFSSTNTVFEVPVPEGTVVSTANGIEFETLSTVTVPRANFGTQEPGTARVRVEARERGPRGNVAAGAIRRLPQSLSAALVTVRNPAPTSGGSREEHLVVTQDDYEAALAELNDRLPSLVATALSDPDTTPVGLTLFGSTASVPSQGDPDQDAEALVGRQADTFELAVSAAASVLAVNEELVDQVAQSQLRQLVPAGTTLLPSTINTTHAPGEAMGDRVMFNASGVAASWRSPGEVELLNEVSGLPVGEARTIMETYGTVEVTIWPDFIDRLPDQNRIRLTIVPPQETP